MKVGGAGVKGVGWALEGEGSTMESTVPVGSVSGSGLRVGGFQAGPVRSRRGTGMVTDQGSRGHSWGQAHRGAGAMTTTVGWALL